MFTFDSASAAASVLHRSRRSTAERGLAVSTATSSKVTGTGQAPALEERILQKLQRLK
jgi:hypothetical protein